MYIKKEDHGYFMGFFSSLDEKIQQNLMSNLREPGGERSGVAVLISEDTDHSIFNVPSIKQSELITRTMIRKAYKTVKEGK